MKLSKLTNRKKIVALDFAGEVVTVTYNPGKITPALSMQDENIVREMANIILEWDLLDEEGKQYPITEDALNALPLDFLAQVLHRVIEDATPNARTPSA